MSKSPVPPLPPGKKAYSYEDCGPMTMEQLAALLDEIPAGFARPGAIGWLADSYRAMVDAGRKATAVYPDDHWRAGARIVAFEEYERLDELDDLVTAATK